MKISKEAFEEYASQVEKEDFEDDIRSLSSSLHQLVGARRDTIKKLRQVTRFQAWFGDCGLLWQDLVEFDEMTFQDFCRLPGFSLAAVPDLQRSGDVGVRRGRFSDHRWENKKVLGFVAFFKHFFAFNGLNVHQFNRLSGRAELLPSVVLKLH